MPEWGDYLRDCLAEGDPVAVHRGEQQVIDVHFFKVAYRKDLDPKPFARRFVASMKAGGYYAPMTPARMKEGPSYIEIGAFLGDQQTALMVMALGKHLGYFNLLIPSDLGLTGEAADKAAGSGYVMAMLDEEGAERMRADSLTTREEGEESVLDG